MLAHLLPPESDGPDTIHAAMRYSVLAGGKRFRPILCIASWEAVAADGAQARAEGAAAASANPTIPDRVLRAASALELIHTYSLIHDDLPALDDDDLRRGRATNHKAFGEATAILAGDALLTYAFEILAEAGGEAVALVARAIGTRGMIGGQVRDIAAEGKSLALEDLETMHREKTGALIACPCALGGLLASAAPATRESLSDYGRAWASRSRSPTTCSTWKAMWRGSGNRSAAMRRAAADTRLDPRRGGGARARARLPTRRAPSPSASRAATVSPSSPAPPSAAHADGRDGRFRSRQGGARDKMPA